MPLTEIEFELPAQQFALMEYPGLRQGQPLSLVLDVGVLAPDPAAESWFTVQPEPLEPGLIVVGPAQYAFRGRIVAAELAKEDEIETGVVAIDCGAAVIRAVCAPQEDGRLPWGTWETRFLAGIGHLQGIVEDGSQTAVGVQTGVTLWHFRRLVLTPGDAMFGQWHESVELPPLPFRYDRVFVTARVHRTRG